jgi:hypothetical protein
VHPLQGLLVLGGVAQEQRPVPWVLQALRRQAFGGLTMAWLFVWITINLAALLAAHKFSVKPQEGVWKA